MPTVPGIRKILWEGPLYGTRMWKRIGSGDLWLHLLTALVVLAVLAPEAAALEDGRIGVLYIGCLARSKPYWLMRSDILFSFNFVQATLRDWAAWGPAQQASEEPQVYRMVRLYMPRTAKQLAENYDVIILANANKFAIGPKNIEMLADAVEESGLGLHMGGGWESFGAAFGRPEWGETSIGALLPTIDVIDTWVQYPTGGLRLVIDRYDHEFVGSLPWDTKPEFMGNYHHNLVRAKDGAEVLAHVEGGQYGNDPAMISWDLENGARVFAMTGEVHTMCWTNPWDYALDFGANLLIYLDRRPVPQDVELVHAVRSKMFQVQTRKSLLLSLVEFCDSFGASTASVVGELDELEATIWDSREIYFDLRFSEMLEIYTDIEETLRQVEDEAVDLKNRALLWVFVVEWLAVTGTAMVCGFVLWSVMIRKRLYREVRTTRLREGGLESA